MQDTDYNHYYASANTAGHGGIGILVKKRLADCITQVDKISDRIIKMTLRCNPQVTIVCVYAPTESADIEVKDTFYNELNDVIRYTPNHNFLVVLGDLNARVGKDSHKKLNLFFQSYLSVTVY